MFLTLWFPAPLRELKLGIAYTEERAETLHRVCEALWRLATEGRCHTSGLQGTSWVTAVPGVDFTVWLGRWPSSRRKLEGATSY